MPSWVSIIAVLGHLVIVVLHGAAHARLDIELNTWQKGYVALVIVAAPLVAAVFLATRHRRVGFMLLVASMAGSLIFGSYYHYVAVSPDHVSHLPPGDSQGLFRLTALLLVLTETFSVVVALLGLRSMRART